MTTNLITSGNTAAVSADVVVTDAAAATIHGKGVGSWTAQIQIKNSDATYTNVGGITSSTPAQTIYGPGTYRVSRPLTVAGITCLVDQN